MLLEGTPTWLVLNVFTNWEVNVMFGSTRWVNTIISRIEISMNWWTVPPQFRIVIICMSSDILNRSDSVIS